MFQTTDQSSCCANLCRVRSNFNHIGETCDMWHASNHEDSCRKWLFSPHLFCSAVTFSNLPCPKQTTHPRHADTSGMPVHQFLSQSSSSSLLSHWIMVYSEYNHQPVMIFLVSCYILLFLWHRRKTLSNLCSWLGWLFMNQYQTPWGKEWSSHIQDLSMLFLISNTPTLEKNMLHTIKQPKNGCPYLKILKTHYWRGEEVPHPWRPIFPKLLILQVVHVPQQPIHLFAVRIKAQDLRRPNGDPGEGGSCWGDPERVPSGEDINVLYINSPHVALWV